MPGLESNTEVPAVVTCTLAIAAERARCALAGEPGPVRRGHNSAAVPAAGDQVVKVLSRKAKPAARTASPGRFLLANPNGKDAAVTLTR